MGEEVTPGADRRSLCRECSQPAAPNKLIMSIAFCLHLPDGDLFGDVFRRCRPAANFICKRIGTKPKVECGRYSWGGAGGVAGREWGHEDTSMSGQSVGTCRLLFWRQFRCISSLKAKIITKTP